MEFLQQFLPIIIYFLLIIIIVVFIVLGIKLIITTDKILKLVDDINGKVEQVTPLFNVLGTVSNKFGNVLDTVVKTIENLVIKLFFKNKNKEDMESDEDE